MTDQAIRSLAEAHVQLERLHHNIASVIKGKKDAITMVLSAIVAGGHLLLEDVPGVGKTTLAHTLAKSLGCSFSRVQFTADMLPSDLLGVSIYNQKKENFEFRRGPLFSQIVLADEINRASPRTQSALLEAMNDKQITVDRETYPLNPPFFVIATQNPLESHGTYPLPDSQLDRFLMRIQLGYPPPDLEKQLLRTRGRQEPVDGLEAVLNAERLLELQALVDQITFDEALQDYLYDLIAETRRSSLLSIGVSTRGALQFHRAVRAYALVQRRDHVLPDDIKTLTVSCLAHRVTPKQNNQAGGWGSAQRQDAEAAIEEILHRIPVPL